MIKEAAGCGKQNSTMLQVWGFDVFYLLDNTLRVGVFTLIKLVFET